MRNAQGSSTNMAPSLRRIRDVPTLWIPLREGRRLAARVWLPVDAEVAPVPAILEAIPYRRRDGTNVLVIDTFFFVFLRT